VIAVVIVAETWLVLFVTELVVGVTLANDVVDESCPVLIEIVGGTGCPGPATVGDKSTSSQTCPSLK